MSTRGVGILLILTSIIAIGALAQSYRLDESMAGERAAAEALERETGAMGEAIGRLQAAQVAQVAASQAAGNWRSRVAALTDDIEGGVAKRRAATRDTGAAASYDEAAGGLQRLRTIDARVNRSLDQGDRLHAANLVFIDDAAAIKSIAESLAAARDRDREAIDRNLTQLARLRLAMTGVAMLFVLGVAIYLGRAVTSLGGPGAQSTAQMLRDLPPPVKPATTAAAPPPAATAQPAQPNLNRPSNLSVAAELCVDLAQVVDARDVPALLERTASVLEARGIVFWAVDPDGARLQPSLSYGYSERVLKKLRPLQVDADNVTSLAYRSLQPQAMNGTSPTDSAAIAIPLLTATGCVGVMAAELRHNRPHVDLLPVARILGAQFSTLIATPDASDRLSAQA